MISLIFLICTLDECRTISPPDTFSSEAECSDIATGMIVDNQAAVKRGEIPEHSVVYVCHQWGKKA